MLSIIQGVAFTDLAAIVFGHHQHFTIVNWIQIATMLWLIIGSWNHFMGDALMTQWIPDLEDALLLFGTGVLELVANHAITVDLTAWLAFLASLLLGWCGGVFFRYARTGWLPPELAVTRPTVSEVSQNLNY